MWQRWIYGGTTVVQRHHHGASPVWVAHSSGLFCQRRSLYSLLPLAGAGDSRLAQVAVQTPSCRAWTTLAERSLPAIALVGRVVSRLLHAVVSRLKAT